MFSKSHFVSPVISKGIFNSAQNYIVLLNFKYLILAAADNLLGSAVEEVKEMRSSLGKGIRVTNTVSRVRLTCWKVTRDAQQPGGHRRPFINSDLFL